MKNYLESNYLILLWTIFLGLGVAVVMYIWKKIYLSNNISNSESSKISNRVLIFEKLFWTLFIVALAISTILSNPLIGLVLTGIFTGLLWKNISNFLQGLLYQLGHDFNIGQSIMFEGKQSVIKSFRNLALEMQLEDGATMLIPYFKFSDSTIIRSSPRTGVLSHSLEILIQKPCDIELEKQKLKSIIVSMPWVIANQKLIFEHKNENQESYQLKIILHGIDQDQMYKVENKLRSKYLKK